SEPPSRSVATALLQPEAAGRHDPLYQVHEPADLDGSGIAGESPPNREIQPVLYNRRPRPAGVSCRQGSATPGSLGKPVPTSRPTVGAGGEAIRLRLTPKSRPGAVLLVSPRGANSG